MPFLNRRSLQKIHEKNILTILIPYLQYTWVSLLIDFKKPEFIFAISIVGSNIFK